MLSDKDLVRSPELREPCNYYIYAIPADKPIDSEREWIRVIYGIEPVADIELADFDFFTHYNGDHIVISCGITGAGRGGFFSRVEAIVALKKGMETIGGADGYYAFIADTVKKCGVSPRWELPKAPPPPRRHDGR